MIVLAHVIIALISVVYTTYLLFAPSKPKLRISYSLVAATIASGTYLIISTHANMLKACMTGLIYIGAISIAIALARHKLAVQKENI